MAAHTPEIAELALEYAGVEELLKYGAVRFPDLAEGHHPILLAGELIVCDLPGHADHLCHGVFECGESVIERLAVSTLCALGVYLPDNTG